MVLRSSNYNHTPAMLRDGNSIHARNIWDNIKLHIVTVIWFNSEEVQRKQL